MYELALGFGFIMSLSILVFFVRHQAFSLFHPLTLYSAFHFLIFVIRPILAVLLEYNSVYRGYGFMPTLWDKTTVILAANLGFASFAFFCLRSGNVPVSFRADRLTLEERKRLTQLFVWVLAICGPIAVYSLARNFSGQLYEGIVLDRGTGTMINTKSNGYLTDAQLMLAPMCAVIAWLGRFRLVSLLPMITFVIMRGSMGGRGPFVAALVMLLLFYLYEKRIRYPALRLALAGAAVAALFNWIGEDRGESLREVIGLQQAEEVFVDGEDHAKFMETMDLANMEFFEYIVWVVPQRSGTYDYFLNNLQIFTEPVPRVLWPGKPIGAPIMRVRLWEYGSPIGMTSSLPGMGWLSMGWLGVIIWCGLWGHVLGYVYRRYWESDQSTIKTAAYMIFIASLVLAYRDGSLLTMVKQTGVYMAPMLVWLMVARYFRVPRLADLRQWATMKARQRRRQMPDGPEADPIAPVSPAVPAAPAGPDLPPAVRRRRLALAGRARNPVGG
ncbi:O-antigen polymerase [Novosphingobium sp. TH158]|uniref:O-antigen polymerase n=1 Tax=Novosphingobium sp. TH158 TaxID=2067455 RepID=UPI000CAFE6D0|nr:O-antigen polymerase [Novosphingobium sp. TH158]PLK27032.1 hypothetical protein C0V78_09160 [Novosphingobium sp. TH158]